ncbi:BA14K family protein [Bartonella florencae]|uniref:BA14K family protein n=1 Tax=Bartonella florencae TaxID=928210 RepID=UPI00031B6BBE|nr:BA14K family protein [Bartonella florencae]
MRMKKKLYYVLAFLVFGSFFIITTNIIHLAKNNSDVEAKMAPLTFVQEGLQPLVFTGRRELNGFKGYRNYRHGYHKYKDNWWYPEAAFVALTHLNTEHPPLKAVSDVKSTLLISSLEKQEPWMLRQHIESCLVRYRSYNKNDNSYQPFYGPRKPCFSRFFKG